jgi:vitamin B12 transporter
MTSQSQNMPSSQHTRGYHWQRRHASAQLKGALLALPLGLFLTSNTIAQTNETSAAIDETVIVASRVADLSHQVGVSVSVLDREDILSLGYPDLGSLLDTQPGVTVTMDGGFGKAAAVRIRGEEGFRTRIVLDGINIADPSSPQISPRIEHILGSELTRVEILRGPQGLLWGADAGGVVLMSTIDQAATTGLDASVEIGGNEFGQAAIKGTYAGEQITGTLSVATLESEGINARDSDNINADRDGYDNTTVHGAIDFRLTEAWSIKISGTDIDGDNEYDSCYDTVTFALLNDCDDRYEQQAWRAAVAYEEDAHSLEVSAASSDTERAFFSAGLLSFGTTGEINALSLLGTWRASPNTRVTYGAEEEKLDDGSTGRERDNTGLYVEIQQQWLDGVITAGWRRDDNDDFGEHNSWRVSARQTLPGLDQWSLRGAVGTGFRAPSLYEIAYNTGPFAYPPATLAPLKEEQSEGWEVGLVGLFGDATVEVIWFDQQIENEIIYDMANYSGYLQTEGKSTSEGIELVGSMALSQRLALEGNFTWNDTAQQGGQQRPYRPEETGRISLIWDQSNVTARLTARHTGKAVDPFLTPIDTTLTLDLTARWTVTPRWSLEARVLNLTDETNQQVPGYRVPGLTAYAGVRVSL